MYGELVLFAELPDLSKAVSIVGFIEKNGLLAVALAHQVVRVAHEQKAILAGHNSPFLLLSLLGLFFSLRLSLVPYEENFAASSI
tara:strand:+ start:80 stop:334 length:255 start_codon:yes stop_codon:yes gene_type:complete